MFLPVQSQSPAHGILFCVRYCAGEMSKRRWWLSRTASIGRRMGGYPPSPHDPPLSN